MTNNTSGKSRLTIAFLLGVCVALGAALVFSSGNALPNAYAQAAGGAGSMFAVTGTGTTQQGKDILFVIDGASQRLLVYEYQGGRLTMGAVRNMEFDVQIPYEFLNGKKKQTPPVLEIKKAVEKGGKKRR
jgi:hypothetical protein